MILSRAKPAIGGEKTEEKGGSAGRKQVFFTKIISKLNSTPFQKYKNEKYIKILAGGIQMGTYITQNA